MRAMKVQTPLPRPMSTNGGFLEFEPSTLSLGLKRGLCPLTVPKFSGSAIAGIDIKSFIEHACPKVEKPPVPPVVVEAQQQSAGGTRWNPTQEQIGILETLYRRGVRTPNARQIEQIRAELGKYGRIEGKNVFYWFQNHKARERQKQKRAAAALALKNTNTNNVNSTTSHLLLVATKEEGRRELLLPAAAETDSKCKKKRHCRSWSVSSEESEVESDHSSGNRTVAVLELFPLHPEGREMIN